MAMVSGPEKATEGVAFLSNRGRYTVFEFGGTRLMVIAPKPLECYLEVTEWDNGYLVVQTKYSVSPCAVEEYIDLVPTLRELYIDPELFCSRIDRVEVAHV
jgi:hypothetical protein